MAIDFFLWLFQLKNLRMINVFQSNENRTYLLKNNLLKLFFVIVCMLFAAEAFGQQSAWQWINPLPQGNPLNAISVIGQDSLVAVGEYGTVIRSFNGGQTWQVQPTVGGITEVFYAVYFVNTTTGWVSGENGRVLKTTDGGASWFNQITPIFNDLFAVQFASNLIGYVAGNGGKILKTTDGGDTWIELSSGSLANFFGLYFLDQSTGWVVGTGGTVLKTSDGGQTWNSQATNIPQTLYAVQFLSSSTGWVVGSTGQVLKTVNGGVTWTPQPQGTNLSFYAMHFLNTSTGYIVGSYGNIRKTTNGGIQWFDQSAGTENDFYAIRFSSTTKGWAVGDQGTILATTDGGTTWNFQSSLNKTEMYGIYFPTVSFGYAVGDVGTILKTENGGVSWTKLDLNFFLPLYGAYFVTFNRGYIVGDSGAIFKTTDAGVHWDRQTTRNENTLYSVYFLDQDNGWAVGDGTILSTTNGGSQWNLLELGFQSYYRVWFSDVMNGVIVGSNGTILKTTNGGTLWEEIESPVSSSLYALSFTSSMIGYAAGDFGTVIKTTDGGTTWNKLDPITGASLFGMAFQNNNQGWAVGDDGTIIATTNGGSNWTQQLSNTFNTLYEIQLVRSSNGGGVLYASGTGATILCSAISPVPQKTWNGNIDSLWTTPGNWTPLGVPEKLESVVIPNTTIKPVIRSTHQQINIAALTIRSGGKLYIGTNLAQFVIKEKVIIAGTLELDPASTTQMFVGDDFVVSLSGRFLPGRSTLYMTNSGKIKGSFYNLVLSEGTTISTEGNIKIQNSLITMANLLLRTIDTLTIINPLPYAFTGSGVVGPGTIRRAIQNGATGTYRFESPVTSLQFYPVGTMPDTILVTPYPNILLYGFPDSLFAKRYYVIEAQGGANYQAFMSLRLDRSEMTVPIDELALFSDSSGVLTNRGVYDYVDDDSSAVSLDSVKKFSMWFFGKKDYFPVHPFEYASSLIVKDNGAGRDTVYFGAAPGATNGLDTLFNEIPLGPKPAPGTFDVRWYIAPSITTKVAINELVHETNNPRSIFNCQVQPGSGGYPMTLQWDSTSFAPGMMFLQDSATAGGLVYINMKAQSSATLNNPVIQTVQIVHTAPTYYKVVKGWNLMSFPLLPVTSSRVKYNYPMAQTRAFIFRDGYEVIDTLPNGVGYWLKFQIPQRVGLEGIPFQNDTIEVASGWNMIGTISRAISINNVTQIPPGILQSHYFGYDNGYLQTDSLHPSKGYWIKVADGGGRLVVSAVLTKTTHKTVEQSEPMAELSIEDNNGGKQSLYLLDEKTFSPPGLFELPPLPPQGAFDTRFATQRFAELLSWKNEQQCFTISIQSSSYPVKITWKPKQMDCIVEFTTEQTGKVLGRSNTKKEARIRVNDPAVSRIVMKITPQQNIPKVYALHQNYPNPFNPFTTISFDLPEESIVTLKVYNILGQEVTTLASDKEFEAGRQAIRWNAGGISSGVYFYRLVGVEPQRGVQRFQQVKKMLLMK
jgi:photosystem II stability/assembly factor-like uncharacterized protein